MAVCALCGTFNYDHGAYDCPHCAKLWQKDLDANRLPPPITDSRDFPLDLWITIRCTERRMTNEGADKDKILARVKELATPYAGSYERMKQIAKEREQQKDMRRIQDYYSY